MFVGANVYMYGHCHPSHFIHKVVPASGTKIRSVSTSYTLQLLNYIRSEVNPVEFIE